MNEHQHYRLTFCKTCPATLGSDRERKAARVLRHLGRLFGFERSRRSVRRHWRGDIPAGGRVRRRRGGARACQKAQPEAERQRNITRPRWDTVKESLEAHPTMRAQRLPAVAADESDRDESARPNSRFRSGSLQRGGGSAGAERNQIVDGRLGAIDCGFAALIRGVAPRERGRRP